MKMNKKILYSAALLAGVLVGLPSCSDDYIDPPVIEPAGGIGTGAWNNPMTAYQARLGTVNYQINPAWVKGYIVGVIDTDESTVLNDKSCDLIPPFTVETNMLIADDTAPFIRLNELAENMEENEAAYTALRDSLLEVVATVQLPSAMRNRLGLVSNPAALYEQVCIQGTTGETYCGEYGVKSLLDYNIGDMGKEPGATPEVNPTGKFYQNFTEATTISALETIGWSNKPTEGNLAGWAVVEGDGNNYIATDAFDGFSGGGPYEHWLITPPIDMDNIADKTLEFQSSAMTQAPGSEIEVYVMNSNDPMTATLNKLNAVFAEAPARGYSEWVNSGKLDLSAYSGIIYIGWRYRAERGGFGNSVTYCLDNINVGNCPEPADWTKASDFMTLLDPSADNGYDDWQVDNVKLTGGLSYIWSWTAYSGQYYLNASAYYRSTNNPALSYTWYSGIDLSGYKSVGINFNHAAKFQTTLPTLGRVVVREVGQTEWTEYQIPAWPTAGSWTFVNSGMIDISDFAGKNIEIGFKYESTEEGADQWEIRSLVLSGIKN